MTQSDIPSAPNKSVRSDDTHSACCEVTTFMAADRFECGRSDSIHPNSSTTNTARGGSHTDNSDYCSHKFETAHSRRSLCSKSLALPSSRSGDEYSHCSTHGDFMMHHVDISKSYGHGTVPIPGRESHTADLIEFDKYIIMLEQMDRGQEELLWKVGGLTGNHLQVNDDLGLEDDVQNCNEMHTTSHPQSIDVDTTQFPSNFEHGEEELWDPLDSIYNELSQQEKLCFPFNREFWSYFRSILSKAIPVGFGELEDPNATIVKGTEDATAFISKVISIKSINPIQPAILSAEGGFDEMEVLAELLYATSVGLVAMRFAPECENCGSSVMVTDVLGRLPGRAHCMGCNTLNTIDSLDNIKVMFLLNSDVLYVLAENFACTPSTESMSHNCAFAPVPATSTGSGFSYCVGTGKDTEIAPVLEPGRYRMHCPVSRTDNYLVVKSESNPSDNPIQLQLKVSDLIFQHREGQQKATLTVPHGRIQFNVFPDTKSFFVLWIQRDEDEKKLFHLPPRERDLYTSASRVMHHPIFNALYQEQQVVQVPKDLLFSISHVVLVFTDIVDSTLLYTNLGDGEAFRLVRKHFQVLFAAFTKRGGRVVKTIGDAVMASFTTGRAALQSIADAMELLPTVGRRPDNQRYLEIRVGLHCGKTTVVPLNGVNDYFGQTTNIAARVQSVAKASECFVTEAVLDSSLDSRECYNEIISPGSAFVATPLTQLNLKGLERQVHARGFRWVKRSLRTSETMSSYNSFNSYANRRAHTQTSLRGASSDDAGLNRGSDRRVRDRGACSGPHNSSWELFVEK